VTAASAESGSYGAPPPDETVRRAVIEGPDAGMRFDLFLARRFAPPQGWTRSAIQKMIADGLITLNARAVKPGTRLHRGDRVEVRAPEIVESRLVPEALPLAVVYEDADCLVIDKAPGMVVHPAAGWKQGTLVNALLHHCPDLSGIGGEKRPGIVHRLDKDTSGLMVVAKNDVAFHNLAAQFKARNVGKEYLALVWGRMSKAAGAIDRPIGRHRSDRKKMSSVQALARAREALTEWRVEDVFATGAARGRFAEVSLLRLRLHSGRTHQIRVHLADEGHAAVGDPVYGPKASALRGQEIDPELLGFPRQALHAESLRFSHPRTGRAMEFHAAPPADMARLLEKLAAGPDRGAKRG
jgi:23S rRNA pseudouridine1911/1915/1917 synthase